MQYYNLKSIFIFFGVFSTLSGLTALVNFRLLDVFAQYWAVAVFLAGVTSFVTVFRQALSPLPSYTIPIGLHVGLIHPDGPGYGPLL